MSSSRTFISMPLISRWYNYAVLNITVSQQENQSILSHSFGNGVAFLDSAQWRKQWIREIKVFKKCPKVNPYCNAIFDPILFKPFLDSAKWPKFCAKNFSLLKKSNIGCIFFIFLWTIMKGWSDNYEIHTMYASCHVQKKPKKHKNSPGSPSLWKWVLSLKV